LPGFTEDLAIRIVAFRDTVGFFLSMYELMSIDGVSAELLESISPWISLIPARDRSITGRISARLTMTQPTSTGEVSRSQQSVGSPLKSALRINLGYGAWALGLKAEKDAGEPVGGIHMPAGMDFYSGFLQYRKNGFVRQVILGDYRVAFGHGLLCNQLYSAGNSPAGLYQPEETRIVRPHTSLDEYYFFRGGAVSLRRKSCWITMFGSIKPLNGNTTGTDPETGKALSVSSIRATGLHNTLPLLEDRHALTEQTAGTNITWRKKKFFAGWSLLSIRYSVPVIPEPTWANRLKFSGQKIDGTSFGLGGFGHHAGATAELAWCNGVPAMSGVAVVKVSDIHTFRGAVRHIGTAFHAPYINTLSATGSLAGEYGMVMMLETTPHYGKTLRLIADAGQILSTTESPVTGRRFRTMTAEITSTSVGLSFRGRFTYDHREETLPELPNATNDLSSITHRLIFRGAGTVIPTSFLKLHLRVDLCQRFQEESLSGYMLAAGMDYNAFRNRTVISFRHTLFSIDHFLVRIYTHEQEAPGGFNMRMLNGKGSRTYLMIRLKPTRALQCWIKGGYTVRQIAVGDNTLPTRWDWSFQVNYTL
jgi:hypothetical protein